MRVIEGCAVAIALLASSVGCGRDACKLQVRGAVTQDLRCDARAISSPDPSPWAWKLQLEASDSAHASDQAIVDAWAFLPGPPDPGVAYGFDGASANASDADATHWDQITDVSARLTHEASQTGRVGSLWFTADSVSGGEIHGTLDATLPPTGGVPTDGPITIHATF